MEKFFRNVEAGHALLPRQCQEEYPPSLWAYYSTLPAWCRDHPIIRNILFAFEYHKPRMDIRQKELAMNFACSLLRPIEGRLKDVIVEGSQAVKIRLDIGLGK